MKRRSFLQRAVFGLGILGFSSLPFGLSRLLYPEVKASVSNRVPLPGALTDPDAFNKACIECGLFHKNDGGPESNNPYINPAEKACTLCGYCMDICPTDALTVTPIREVAMGIAQIDRVACYPWVDKGICGACVSICPIGDKAIDYAFGNFYRPVVKDACVGCGLCVEVCPEPSLPIRIMKRSESTVARHGLGSDKVEVMKDSQQLKY